MPTPNHFSTELLQASNSEKLAYFQRYTVVHRRLKEAYDAFVSGSIPIWKKHIIRETAWRIVRRFNPQVQPLQSQSQN